MNSGFYNPYIAGRALSEDSDHFFGRQNELEVIEAELGIRGLSLLVLFGQRRIGKTSLLLQLQKRLSQESFFSVYFDLQDQVRRPQSMVLYDLANSMIQRSKNRSLHIDPNHFDNEGIYFRNNFLEGFLAKLPKHQRLVFLFDEFEALGEYETEKLTNESAGRLFFQNLRQVLAISPRIASVIVVGRHWDDLSRDYTSLFKGAIKRDLWVLDQTSAEELIRQAEQDGSLSFKDDAIKKILKITSRHPYLLQLICQRIWQNAHLRKPNISPVISIQDVDKAIPDVIEMGGAFQWWWDGLSPAERICTAAMAEKIEESTPISNDEVIKILNDVTPRLRTPEISFAPRDLVKRKVLVLTDDTKYVFSVDLFRRWIKQNKSLRLVKDELDSLYGAAHYLFQTGENYFRRGEFNKALGYFENALEEDPRHFRARLYLGRALLESGKEIDAINALEEAYRLDHEETQSYLAQALLTFARQLKNSQFPNAEEDILKACNRVMDILPDNLEAIEITNDIWNRRGEIAIREQSWEYAMKAFRNAKNDGKILEVQSLQKRENISIKLLNDAKRALQINDWRGAFSHLDELISRNPGFSQRIEYEELLARASFTRERYESSRKNVETPRFITRTNPTLIIGLGGSGQWVVTYLKKELLESGGGKIPEGIQLVSIDTTTSINHVGPLELDRQREVIVVGNNVRSFAESISRQENTQFLKWFQSEYFLRSLPISSFNTREGSGRLRQMGRISLFHDLSYSSVTTKNIERAITSLASQAGNLQIIIVSSMTGGTGSGMLTDIGLLIQQITHEKNISNYTISGYFTIETQDLHGLSNAFATWRELDRYMLSNENFGPVSVNYPLSRSVNSKISRPVYDAVYIIEPVNPGEDLENDFFPSVANAIYIVLDQKAGNTVQVNKSNLSRQYSKTPRAPFYSILGSYSIKYPEYLIRKKFAAKVVFDAFVKMTNDETVRNRTLLDKNNNIDRQLKSLYRKDGEFDVFLSELVQRRERISKTERLFLYPKDINFLVLSVANKQSENESKELLRQMNMFFSRKENPDLQAHSGWSSEDYLLHVRYFENFRKKHYGEQDLNEILSLDSCGDLGKLLENIKNSYIKSFKEGLREWSDRSLNHGLEGFNNEMPANLIEIQYILNELGDILYAFIASIRDTLHIEWQRSDRLSTGFHIVQRTRKVYESLTRRKTFLLVDIPRRWSASRAQTEYISAEQRLFESIREKIFLQFLYELTVQVNDVVAALRGELSKWVNHLSPATNSEQIENLGNTVRSILDEVNWASKKREHTEYEKYIGEKEYVVSSSIIEIFLRSLRWDANILDGGNIQLKLGVKRFDEDEIWFVNSDRKGETLHNLELLQSLAESLFYSENKKSTLTNELIREFPDPHQLAYFLTEKASPWFSPAIAYRESGLVTEAVYLGGDHQEKNEIEYFEVFESALKTIRIGRKSDSLDLHEMADPYRLSIYRSDHFLTGEDFAIWRKSQEAYMHWIENNPNMSLHIFPEEQNAQYYESLILKLLRTRRILHPRIVTLLHDKEKFELFFHALNLGFIKHESEHGQAFWRYQGVEDLEPLYLSAPSQTLERLGDSENILQVIHNFVVDGRDQRPNRVNKIDWDMVRKDVNFKEREYGNEALRNKLTKELRNDDGIIKFIQRNYSELPTSPRQNESSGTMQAELDDLISIVTVIYMNMIDALSLMDER